MKTLKNFIDEGLFRKNQRLMDHENPKMIIYDIIQRLIYSFEEYGKFNEDELNKDDFFNRIYDLFDKEDGFDSVYLLYNAWVNNTINNTNVNKYLK